MRKIFATSKLGLEGGIKPRSFIVPICWCHAHGAKYTYLNRIKLSECKHAYLIRLTIATKDSNSWTESNSCPAANSLTASNSTCRTGWPRSSSKSPWSRRLAWTLPSSSGSSGASSSPILTLSRCQTMLMKRFFFVTDDRDKITVCSWGKKSCRSKIFGWGHDLALVEEPEMNILDQAEQACQGRGGTPANFTSSQWRKK